MSYYSFLPVRRSVMDRQPNEVKEKEEELLNNDLVGPP